MNQVVSSLAAAPKKETQRVVLIIAADDAPMVTLRAVLEAIPRDGNPVISLARRDGSAQPAAAR